MVRRLAVLVTAALLVSAVLPASLAAADPPKNKLSKQDRAQLAKAAVAGDKTITVLIAAQKGANRTVATGIAALGGTVQYREDELDYIRAIVPAGKVEAAAGLKGVQALEIDAVIPLPDPRPGTGIQGATVPTPYPAPDASTPRHNPYMPIGDTGAAQFTAAHPTWDGRGVTVGILDLGVSLDHPALQTTTVGTPKIVDWVTYTAPFTDNDPTWVTGDDRCQRSYLHDRQWRLGGDLHCTVGRLVPLRHVQRARPAAGR